MNSVSSFYDGLNKFIIGFLIAVSFYCCFSENLTIISGLGIIVLCWLLGIFFWIVTESFLSHVIQSIPFFERNNLKWINKEYDSIIKSTGIKYTKKNLETQLDSLELNDYYIIYYEVQKKGLLGSVPVLESYSAFFTNMIYICLLWIVLLSTGCCNLESIICMHKCCLVLLLLALIIVLPYFRKNIECKIYNSILNAYFLGVIVSK